jgi:hypothetical protein
MIRPLVILVCLVGLAGWMAYLKTNSIYYKETSRQANRQAVGPVCLLVHIILFEVVVIMRVYHIIELQVTLINEWSQVIWLQTAITTALYAFTLICEHRYAKARP